MEETSLIIEIALRFIRIVEAHHLEPAHTADQLAARLIQAHTREPLELRALLIADEVDLIVKVSAAIRTQDVLVYHTETGQCRRLV